MRKLILISALALASVAAQAGQPRGVSLASNDERIVSGAPEAPKAPIASETSRPASETATPVEKTPRPPVQSYKPVKQAFKPAANKAYVRGYEKQEAEARRIAAAYGFRF
jgi:hypothetical protein